MNVCPECSGAIVSGGHGVVTTLVGYSSPLGHNHDDNCRKSAYTCENGHTFAVIRRNRCNTTNPDGTACQWVGKDQCFCWGGKFLLVDKWPTVQWNPA